MKANVLFVLAGLLIILGILGAMFTSYQAIDFAIFNNNPKVNFLTCILTCAFTIVTFDLSDKLRTAANKLVQKANE